MKASRAPSLGKFPLAAVERLNAAFAPAPIRVREKYVTSMRTSGNAYSVTIEDYFTHENWARERRLVCPEDYSEIFQEATAREVSGSTSTFGYGSWGRVSVHAAYGGSVTPMHFDWDNSAIQHICLSGRRTLWVCSPDPQRRLPTIGNSVLADFEVMDAGQRERILLYFGAIKFEMHPGDFVRFSSNWWHMVEYNQASLAISIRAELEPLIRPLTILPRSPELQYVIDALIGESGESVIRIVATLVRAFLGCLTEGGSVLCYIAVVGEVQLSLGLDLMNPNPWVLPEFSVNKVDQRLLDFLSKSDCGKERIEQRELCKEWLFGNWPDSSPLSVLEMSMLADVMAYSFSPPLIKSS